MPDRRVAGPPPAWWFSAATYAGIGTVGVLLLATSLYRFDLGGIAYAGDVRLGFAVAGGALAMLGFGRWNVLRHYPGGGRRRPERRRPEPPPPFQSYVPPPRTDERPQRKAAPPLGRMTVGGARRAPAPAWSVAVVGVLALIGLVVSGLPLPVAPASAPAHAPAAPATPAVAPPTRANPPPAGISCTPLYPIYYPLGTLFPLLPKYSSQSPCHISHDEVHASFSSIVPGSGDAVEFPVHLPGSGNNSTAGTYADFYLGMVVKGDPFSVDGQEYAALVFAPSLNVQGATVWSLSIAIWSLELNTSCSNGLNFTWRGYYGCENDDVGSGLGDSIATGVPGNASTNVTFVGSATQTSRPLEIYFNDSTDPSDSTSWTATAKETGSYLFQPYYTTACPDKCLLNWSMPLGLGEGVDLCDYSGCFSYNATTQLGSPPFEVGAPRFWNGLNYTNDYYYVSLESSTGACGAVGGVAPCTPDAEAGIYPGFTFNGTTLDFGGNYSFATEDFGGSLHQFNAYATSTDFVPLFLDELTNTSRAGYVAPGDPLNVSVRAQALGTVRWVNLSYAVPGEQPMNASMSLVYGNATEGIYNGTIPASGNNGTITFRAVATDAANATVALPIVGTPPDSVSRTPIPTISIGLTVVPAGCGGISLNGAAALPNGSTGHLLAGVYPIEATGCYPYAFVGWQTTGGTTIAGTGPTAELTAHTNGTVTARFVSYHPLDSLTLEWDPSTCGETILNGSFYAASGSAQYVQLRDAGSYSLYAESCGGDSFEGWSVSNPANLSILGTNLTLHGNGTLTASFVTTSTSFPVVFETDPSTCGGVDLYHVGYTNGESVNLPAGNAYPVGPDPCAGYGYAAGNVTTAGSVSVSGGTLSVSGAGTVEYFFYKLTLVDIVTSPVGCGGVDWDGVLEAGGAVLNVTNHTVHSVTAEPCAGYYTERLAISGDLVLSGSVITVNGPGTVEAVFRAGVQTFFVGFITYPATCGAIVFDGSSYANAQFADVLPESVHTVSASPCAGYGLVQWVMSGSIAVVGDIAYVNSSGSIEAVFHPLVPVDIGTDPGTCGAVVIAGTAYANGSTAMLPENAVYSVGAAPCSHDVLSYWVTTGGATIANGTLDLSATAIVVAVFVPALYPITVSIEPGSCGQVTVGTVDYSNGANLSLPAGPYFLAGSLCPGFELLAWHTTGGLTISGGSLIVTGPGNLTEVAGPIPPTVSVTVPATTGVGAATFFAATIQVPVPPYNYSYNWSFGDGTTAVTPSNFTSHTYASTGTYTVTVTVHDPYGRVAVASGSVTVVSGAVASNYGIGTTGLVLIVVAALVVVAGAVVAVVQARRARRAAPDEPLAPEPIQEEP